MDTFDIRILAALQRDGRASNQQLAEAVFLSPSQCSRRRTVLENDGIIRGYYAGLDPAALGLTVTALIQVTLASHNPNTSRDFKALVERVPAIQEAYAVTGDADYVLKVNVANLKALSALLGEVLLPHPTVAHVRSSVVLDTLKSGVALPLDTLETHHGS